MGVMHVQRAGEPTQGIACSSCGQQLAPDAFSSAQRRKADDQRRCKECVGDGGAGGDAAATEPSSAKKSGNSGTPSLRTRADFDRMIKAAGEQLVVVNFGAAWCGECRKFAPFVAQLSAQFSSESPSRALFVKVDVDQSDELVSALKPSALPCFLFFVRGKKVDTLVGAQQTVLRKKVVKHCPAQR